MDDLQLLLSADPDTTEIQLNERYSLITSYSELEEINTILPILSDFVNLQILDLSDNELKSLPLDLSSLTCLHSLDITNNPFESLVEVASSLQTLPLLRSLSINLQTNEEVELILTSLPKLELLNGQGIFLVKV